MAYGLFGIRWLGMQRIAHDLWLLSTLTTDNFVCSQALALNSVQLSIDIASSNAYEQLAASSTGYMSEYIYRLYPTLGSLSESAVFFGLLGVVCRFAP